MPFFQRVLRNSSAVLVIVCTNLAVISLYGLNSVKREGVSKPVRESLMTEHRPNASHFSPLWPDPPLGSRNVSSTFVVKTTPSSSLEHVPNWSWAQKDSFQRQMKERRLQITNACDSFKAKGTLPKPRSSVYKNLVLMKESKIVWCPVFKASSSTWLSYLLDISSLPKTEKEKVREKYKGAPLKFISRFTVRPVGSAYDRYMEEVNDVKSFIITRHPFNRLVSAFRDKIERFHTPELKSDFYYKIYGAPIVSRFRSAALKRFGRDYFKAENNFGAPIPVEGGKRTGDMPSFWEFVQYVKTRRVNWMDEHFRPIYDYCSPCTINYNTVIHFENLAEESQFLKYTLDPDSRDSPEIGWMNPNLAGMNLNDLTKTYFQSLSKDDIMALYKIYELDMKMFGYTYSVGNLSLPLP